MSWAASRGRRGWRRGFPHDEVFHSAEGDDAGVGEDDVVAGVHLMHDAARGVAVAVGAKVVGERGPAPTSSQSNFAFTASTSRAFSMMA